MNLADHSSYSRDNLGDPIWGRDFRERLQMEVFSQTLLRALWREHGAILSHLGAVWKS